MSKKFSDVMLVGFALFAMFFGAGNLIFPPYMGLLAGSSWGMAAIGFFVTGIGMPLLGIMASARAGGTVEHLGRKVSPVFGRILSIVIILAIGPLLAIPRTGATTFEMGVRPLWPELSPLFSSVAFFGLTLFFSLNRSAVVDRIGKILTPFLLLTLAWIIVKGVLTPLGPLGSTSFANPFGNGFREGYQTMDAMASVVFAEIIIAALVFKGYSSSSDQVRMTSLAGVVAASGLGLVYGGLMYLGATASSAFGGSIERTDLLIGIAEHLLGSAGRAVLGLAVALACLTTSVGLTATVGDYFSAISGGRWGYKWICAATCVFSAVFATVGVTTIVSVAVPLLVTVYPVVICLVLLTMFGRSFRRKQVYTGAVIGALSTSVFDALTAAGWPIGAANRLVSHIPLADSGFPWIVPALIGGLVGLGISLRKERNSRLPSEN